MRLVRIYPLYLLGCLIKLIAIVCTGVEAIGGGGHLLLFCLMALFMVPNFFMDDPGTGKPNIYPMNGPSWSLFFELGANFFYAFMLRTLNMRALFVILLFSALGNIVCMHLTSSHNLDVGWTAKNFPAGLFRVGYSFYMGVFLYRLFRRRRPSPRGTHNSFIAYAVLVASAVLLTLRPPQNYEAVYDFVVVTVLFPCLVYLGMVYQPKTRGARICKFFGVISYPVYILLQNSLAFSSQEFLRHLHHITVPRAWSFAGLDFIYDSAPFAGLALLAVLLPITWCLNRLYDEPVRRHLLKRWRGRSSARFAIAEN
jgi:peptidoglycan/LPS O-acetylase OafA/YrhL